MDLAKLKQMAVEISDNISTCEIGELLFMHHVILETLDLVQDLEEGNDARQLCVGVEQSIYNEISRRIATGKLKMDDPGDFMYQIKQYYENQGPAAHLTEDIKSSLLDKKTKRKTRKKLSEFDEKLAKRGNEFFEKYRSMFKIKPLPYSRVPTPEEIINSKSPKDIPNN